jgi:NADPH:quinone reductase-like Zn-dependent oxidoreductase
VAYTGSPLGAYSTVRVMPAAPLVKLPQEISCETAAAMMMRGLTSAYLLRRIYRLKAGDTILFHAAAGIAAADVAAAAVLKNNVVVGSVNANKRHWYKAGQALARADRSWLARLLTRRERPENFMTALHREPEDIKVVIQFAQA